MATFTKLPSGAYRVRIRRAGSPLITRSFPTRKIAQAWADEQESALAGSATLPLAIREYRSANNLTLAILFERYFDSWNFSKKSPTTQKGERSKSKPVLQLLGQYSIVKINSALLATYRDTRVKTIGRLGKELSGDQVRLEMALLCVDFG
jgi:hypothetical protein